MEIPWERAQQLLEEEKILYESRAPSFLTTTGSILLIVLGAIPALMFNRWAILLFLAGIMFELYKFFYLSERFIVTKERILRFRKRWRAKEALELPFCYVEKLVFNYGDVGGWVNRADLRVQAPQLNSEPFVFPEIKNPAKLKKLFEHELAVKLRNNFSNEEKAPRVQTTADQNLWLTVGLPAVFLLLIISVILWRIFVYQ